MPSWIVYAAIVSIAAASGLAWLLWRINTPQDGGADARKSDAGSDSGTPIYVDGGGSGGRPGKLDADSNDGGSDGGSDGGGGDGGGDSGSNGGGGGGGK